MSTEPTVKSKTLEFIEYLRSTDEYRSVFEQFKEYLKTAEWDRSHVIIYSFDQMGYDWGEVFSVCDRTDSLIILAHGHFWKGEVEIRPDKYD